jgi:hypothetical protein
MTKNKAIFPFILITSLFFLWGFAHNLDPILIPHLKKSFSLTVVQATLVDRQSSSLICRNAYFGLKEHIVTGIVAADLPPSTIY